MNIGKRFAWVSAYAIAMAFLEAVVVVYIRGSPQPAQAGPLSLAQPK